MFGWQCLRNRHWQGHQDKWETQSSMWRGEPYVLYFLLYRFIFQAHIHSPFKDCDIFSYPDSNLEAKLIDININQQVEVKTLTKAGNIPSELDKGVEPFIAIKQRFFNQKSPNKKQRNVSFSYLDNLVGMLGAIKCKTDGIKITGDIGRRCFWIKSRSSRCSSGEGGPMFKFDVTITNKWFWADLGSS